MLAATSLLAVGLRPYWIARYRGVGADLRGAKLRGAPLPGANLQGANLGASDLRSADLRGADLMDADLRDADLRGADLGGTALEHISDLVTITQTISPGRVTSSTRGADPNLTGARYDAHTRWPAGFDPARHGAIRADAPPSAKRKGNP
jgi:hypothetical protein